MSENPFSQATPFVFGEEHNPTVHNPQHPTSESPFELKQHDASGSNNPFATEDATCFGAKASAPSHTFSTRRPFRARRRKAGPAAGDTSDGSPLSSSQLASKTTIPPLRSPVLLSTTIPVSAAHLKVACDSQESDLSLFLHVPLPSSTLPATDGVTLSTAVIATQPTLFGQKQPPSQGVTFFADSAEDDKETHEVHETETSPQQSKISVVSMVASPPSFHRSGMLQEQAFPQLELHRRFTIPNSPPDAWCVSCDGALLAFSHGNVLIVTDGQTSFERRKHLTITALSFRPPYSVNRLHSRATKQRYQLLSTAVSAKTAMVELLTFSITQSNSNTRSDIELSMVLSCPSNEYLCASWSPNGSAVFLAHETAFSVWRPDVDGDDIKLRRWHRESSTRVLADGSLEWADEPKNKTPFLDPKAAVLAAWSPDCTRVAIGQPGKDQLRILDMTSIKGRSGRWKLRPLTIDSSCSMTSLCWSMNNNFLAVGSSNSVLVYVLTSERAAELLLQACRESNFPLPPHAVRRVLLPYLFCMTTGFMSQHGGLVSVLASRPSDADHPFEPKRRGKFD